MGRIAYNLRLYKSPTRFDIKSSDKNLFFYYKSLLKILFIECLCINNITILQFVLTQVGSGLEIGGVGGIWKMLYCNHRVRLTHLVFVIARNVQKLLACGVRKSI